MYRPQPGSILMWGMFVALLVIVPWAVPRDRFAVANAPAAAISACSDHNPTVWHEVVKRDAGGAILCTYGHEHKANPHDLDSLFGGFSFPQEISHPWETPMENLAKHRVYGWYVQPPTTCQPANGDEYGIDAWRVQAHMDGHGGALTRVHSFSMEASVCKDTDPAYNGSFRIGGWNDFGRLLLDDEDHVALPADQHPDCGQVSGASRRLHQSASNPAPANAIWYGGQNTCTLGLAPKVFRLISLAWSQEDWGPIDPMQPNDPLLYFGPGGAHGASPDGVINGQLWNGSRARMLHDLSIFFDGPPGTPRNSFFSWSGYVNRYGQMATGCSAPALDCIPVSLVNVRNGVRYHYAAAQGNPFVEFDAADPQTGQSLIVYPN